RQGELQGRRRVEKRDRGGRKGRRLDRVDGTSQAGGGRSSVGLRARPPSRQQRRDGTEYEMASAAEQLAANLNFGALAKAEELKKRIWFTLGALLIYRLGTYIPLPGVNPGAVADLFQRNASGI